jgi:hypothetical protein
MNVDCIFPDNGARPDMRHEIVLGDQFAGRLGQGVHDFECARADRNRPAARSQFALRRIEFC